MYTITKEAFN